MKSTMTLQVETDTLLKLIGQLRVRGRSQDLSTAITSAIELWLRGQTRLASGCDPASVRGYQWKSLFLPEGTVLRSWSYGENNYARVVGDHIIHDGKAVSPNEFAQSFARTTRNAWTDLYIRRPEDQQFQPRRVRAGTCRSGASIATGWKTSPSNNTGRQAAIFHADSQRFTRQHGARRVSSEGLFPSPSPPLRSTPCKQKYTSPSSTTAATATPPSRPKRSPPAPPPRPTPSAR